MPLLLDQIGLDPLPMLFCLVEYLEGFGWLLAGIMLDRL